ncbi:MAG: protein kinase domain-containing protein [Alphaproteobacteria bacterium]
MTSIRTCPRCGATLPAGRSACPRCLLELARAPEPSGEEPAPAPRRREAAPTPAELAPDFPELEVFELLGEGGMGCVYRARHRQLGRAVALKILAPGTEDDARFVERFLREARALARLDHPGIVRVHDFGRAGKRLFMTMELVEGTTLRELLREKRISAREALAIVPQICDALQYAHDEGVVHRDIKPENVLVDVQGRVKLADFGLAKLVGPADEIHGRTHTGQGMGTPHYMAPEQATSARDVDHRADIYSLGVVFYEMLTGELPLGRFEPPSKRASIDARLDRIVLKSLERAPELRYQQAVEVGADVAGLATRDAKAGNDNDALRTSAKIPALEPKPAPHAHVVRGFFERACWVAAILAAWLVFWVSLGSAFAAVALPTVSVLVLAFLRSGVAPEARAWRFGLAFARHALGCLAFAVDRVHLWDASTPDYQASNSRAEWGDPVARRRAVEVAAELIAMGPANDLRAEHTGGTHVGDVPAFDQEQWALVAIVLWLVAAAALFASSARWNWSGLVRPALLLVGVSTLTAWLAVERIPIGSAPRRVELSERLEAPTTIERAERAIERFAADQDFDTRLITRWKITHATHGWDSGRGLLYVFEDQAPWRRWRFDVLHGPKRLTPRVSVLVVETGRWNARIEVRLGALDPEPEERSATWRELGAKLAEALRN